MKVRRLTSGPGEAEMLLLYRRLRQPWRLAVPVGEMRLEEAALPMQPGPDTADDLPQRSPDPALVGQETELEWSRTPSYRDSLGAAVLSGSLSLPAPWPVCPWQDAVRFSTEENVVPAVTRLNQDFWSLLHLRDVGGLMRLATVRAHSLAATYHLHAAEVEEALLFPALVKAKEWTVAPLPRCAMKTETAGQGRLVRLVVEETGENPIRLVNEEKKIEAVIEAWWGFTQGWEMLR